VGPPVRVLEGDLVAPVPRLAIMVGRTLGGATVAVLQGTLIFVVPSSRDSAR